MIFSLFTKSLVIVDTSLSKIEIFLRKGNYWKLDPFAEDTVGPAISLKQHAGLLFSHNISEINVMDYREVVVLQKIPISQDAWSMMQIGPVNTLVAIGFSVNEVLIQKYDIDVKSKRVSLREEKKLDETHKINDMDMNRYLLASATTEGNIKLRRLNHLD